MREFLRALVGANPPGPSPGGSRFHQDAEPAEAVCPGAKKLFLIAFPFCTKDDIDPSEKLRGNPVFDRSKRHVTAASDAHPAAISASLVVSVNRFMDRQGEKRRRSSDESPGETLRETEIRRMLEGMPKEYLVSLQLDAALKHWDVAERVLIVANTDISYRKIFVSGLGSET
ncbi:unnamed protein product [Closterium sp. Naga37s-1]|nr:unnamed protein product [Closterium sp. Naga37s-1]